MKNAEIEEKNGAKNVDAIYDLSPLQLGMLFQTKLRPDAGFYVVQSICEFQGNINLEAFKEAWKKIILRYSVHRTLFIRLDTKQPLQIVRKHVDLPWLEFDWSTKSAEENALSLNELLNEDRKKGYNISIAPLMRLYTIKTSEKTWCFIWSRHHAISDGWSLPIVMKDILSCYATILKSDSISLPFTRPYRDYIVWLGKIDKSKGEIFWKNNLEGLNAPTPLTIDYQKINEMSENIVINKIESKLDVDTSYCLQQMVRKEQLTLNILMQSIWGILLGRYADLNDVLFGAVVSVRPPDIVDSVSMVGCLLNTIPIRLSIPNETNIIHWLKQQHFIQVERQEFSYMSLIDIQKGSNIKPNLPMFESLVVFENYPIDGALLNSVENLEIKAFYTHEQTTLPLTVIIVPGDQISIKILFHANRLEESAVEKLLKHYINLLLDVANNPTKKISELSLIDRKEYEELIHNNANEYFEMHANETFIDFFERQCESSPAEIALYYNNIKMNYHELNTRSNQLARHLSAKGVKPGEKVGVFLDRSEEMIITLLAILKLGAAYIPIDSKYPKLRIEYIINDAKPKLIITNSYLQQHLPVVFPSICLDLEMQSINLMVTDNLKLLVTSEMISHIIYTSGSTGELKGVMINHRNLINFLSWAKHFFIKEELSGVLASTSICFDLSVFEIFLPLICGGAVILCDNLLSLNILPAKDNVTLINTVPSILETFLKSNILPVSVKTINLAGEPLSRALVNRINQKCFIKRIYNLYGPTEDTTYSTVALVDKTQNKPYIGTPISNTESYILDSNMTPVPLGIPGELYLGGGGVSLGYYNKPDLTAERFLPDPFSGRAGARLYKTGDLVCYSLDKQIEYIDRIDNQVKIRGFRIELGEVEKAISKINFIQEVIVTKKTDEKDNSYLVAYLRVENNKEFNIELLRSDLKFMLPDYMIPAFFEVLEEFPLTSNGKIDRKALSLQPLRQFESKQTISPKSKMEIEVAKIWKDILCLDSISINDNFFEIGGNSLLLFQMHHQIKSKLNVNIPITDLFKYTKIMTLAKHLEGNNNEDRFAHINARLNKRKVRQQEVSN